MSNQPYRPGTAPWLRIAPVRRFVLAYGWRAYAVAALSALTLVVLIAPDPRPSHPAQASADSPLPSASAHPSVHASAPSGAGPSAPASPSTRSAGRSSSGPINSAQPQVADGSVPAAASCTSNSAARLVVVSISAQHAWMCQNTTLVKDTPVTTGRDGADYTTPTGTWQVVGKQTDRDLVGPGYSEYVHYWVPFFGDFGFHDATWQTMPFGDQAYRTQGSHGCVHLPTATMRWLYGWIQVGSTVTVVR